MKNRVLLFLLLALGIISTAEVVTIITTVSPNKAEPQIFWTFFILLFVMVSAFASIIWHSIKKYLIYRYHTPVLMASVRQASLLTAVAVLSLFFNSLGILSFWDIIPLFISAILIEFYFQADKSTPQSPPS